MKAIRVKEFGGPEKLQLEEVPGPKAGPGQVVVKIERESGGSLHALRHLSPQPSLPYTPGTDGAGTFFR